MNNALGIASRFLLGRIIASRWFYSIYFRFKIYAGIHSSGMCVSACAGSDGGCANVTLQPGRLQTLVGPRAPVPTCGLMRTPRAPHSQRKVLLPRKKDSRFVLLL